MSLDLKAGDGDLLLITEPALQMRCALQLHAIYRPALVNAIQYNVKYLQ